MTDLAPLFSGALVVFLVLALIGERGGRGLLLYIAKPAASACFLAAAIAVGALESTYGQAIFAALVLCWFGDVFLMGRARRWFLSGLVSFLLGHLAFAVAFVIGGVDWTHVGLSLIPLAISIAVVGRWLLPHVSGGMKGPVMAYMLVISVMVAAAAGTVSTSGSWLVLLAAILFYASDLFVARERFVSPGELVNRAVGLPLYYAAQLVFVWSLA